jgi:hypothetical protein
MFASARTEGALARWLTTVAALVAILAQLSVALAPLGEAREGVSAAAHVETGGTATHYAHNDATCVVCKARSLHGLTARVPDASIAGRVGTNTVVGSPEPYVAAEFLSTGSPRAPPSSI